MSTFYYMKQDLHSALDFDQMLGSQKIGFTYSFNMLFWHSGQVAPISCAAPDASAHKETHTYMYERTLYQSFQRTGLTQTVT